MCRWEWWPEFVWDYWQRSFRWLWLTFEFHMSYHYEEREDWDWRTGAGIIDDLP